MKKLILSIATVAVFAFTSCSSDDDNGGKSCEELTTELSAAAEAYGEDPSVANCNAFKSAIEAYVNKDCEDAESLEAVLELLEC
tara:strand:- start:7826 stop:8077 length:252 start_codon:yes stop_codon:yes gene_type:complete